jgi:predicted nucleic acid-binding protein
LDRGQVGSESSWSTFGATKIWIRSGRNERDLLLAKELGANPVLLDDYRARKLAEGLDILGSVGLLETFYLRRYLTDLRSVFRQLLLHNVYIDQRLLDRRLRSLGLPAL